MRLFQIVLGRILPSKTSGTNALRVSGRRLHLESLEGRDLFTAVPITIVNHSYIDAANTPAYPDAEVNVAVYAQQQETQDFYIFDANGTPYLASQWNGKDIYTFPMTLMPIDTNGNRYLNMPDTMPGSQFGPIGARLYFAMDTPPVLPVVGGKVVAMAPGSEYFDYIEFTINGPNSAGTAGLNNLNIDTTNVDQFGIPIQVEVASTELSGGTDTVGINLTRNEVITAFQSYTSGAGDPYAICLTAEDSGAYGKYRILNPSGLFEQADVQNTALQVQTLLQVTVNAVATTINVYDSDSFPDPADGPFYILINNEQMIVTAASKGLGTSTNWTVTRGVNGSQAVPHSATTLIQMDGPAMSTTTTMLTMSNTTGYPNPNVTQFYVQVDEEIMKVTAADPQSTDGKTTWTVARMQFGTGPATHTNNSLVYYNSARDLALNSIFNTAVDDFYQKYLSTNAAPETLTLVSNKDHHTYAGTVVHFDETNGTGPMVLRFLDQTDTANTTPIDVYYPFFNNNLYFWGGYTPLLPVGDAPLDLIAANVENMSPSYMTFGCLGVFGDSGERTNLNGTQQGVLGDLENQVVAALNRGVAMIANTDGNAWKDSSQYYGLGTNTTDQPFNHYAAFLHQANPEISLDQLNYGFAYDDNNGQASDIAVGSLSSIQGILATLTPWAKHDTPPAPTPPTGGTSMRDFMSNRLPYTPPQGASEQLSTPSSPEADPQAVPDASPQSIVDEALADPSTTDDLAWLQALDNQGSTSDGSTNGNSGFSMRDFLGRNIH
jgi:hypothetical protein